MRRTIFRGLRRLTFKNLFLFFDGVADPAEARPSGGDAELREKPLRQDEPNYEEESDADPLIHNRSIL